MKSNNRRLPSMKHLIDNSYLPLDVLHTIQEDRKLLELSHMFPHWFQRRILEIKQVFNVNLLGPRCHKEHNSGIYIRVFIDDFHQVVLCVHKYHYRFIDVQVAVRTYKSLKTIIEDFKVQSHFSIINGMDFCVDLPNEFFNSCPKWDNDRIRNEALPELNKESNDYSIDSYIGHVGIVCNRHYVHGGWNIMIYPDEITPSSLSFIKDARPRIDNLLEVLHKNNVHTSSDVAIGVLPLDKEEMIKYKEEYRYLKIIKKQSDYGKECNKNRLLVN